MKLKPSIGFLNLIIKHLKFKWNPNLKHKQFKLRLKLKLWIKIENKKYKPLIKTIDYELKPKNSYQKLSFQHYEIQN